MRNISVIIPMYNSADTIEDALNSVFYQTRIDAICEIIVINDGSTDDSENIVKRYAQEHTSPPIIVLNKENGGAASARNAGFRIARGEWLALLDADDEWLPKKTERQLEILDCNKDIDFLGTNYEGADLNILGRRITGLYKATLKDITLKSFPTTPSVLMKKKIYDEIGGYNENLRYAEDGQYIFRICTKYNYYILAEPLVRIGHGKRTFGERGLSANLPQMHRGYVISVKELREQKLISGAYYAFLRVFYFAKYLRRIAITKFSRK